MLFQMFGVQISHPSSVKTPRFFTAVKPFFTSQQAATTSFPRDPSIHPIPAPANQGGKSKAEKTSRRRRHLRLSKELTFQAHDGSMGMVYSTYMDVSKNGGTQQPWVFLLKMIILWCFGVTPIFGNIHMKAIP